MSKMSAAGAGSADADLVASEGGQVAVPVGEISSRESGRGDRRTEGDASQPATENVSGIRSMAAAGSVPASSTPGPTSSVLRQLASDVQGDTSIVEQFVSDYLSLLNGRLGTLQRLVTNTDDDATVVSILSLETTSAMIGAGDVVSAAHTLRTAVEEHHQQRIDDAFRQLEEAVTDIRKALSDLGFSGDLRPRPAAG
jgi:hypothetical protein